MLQGLTHHLASRPNPVCCPSLQGPLLLYSTLQGSQAANTNTALKAIPRILHNHTAPPPPHPDSHTLVVSCIVLTLLHGRHATVTAPRPPPHTQRHNCHNFGWWMDWLDALSVSTQPYSHPPGRVGIGPQQLLTRQTCRRPPPSGWLTCVPSWPWGRCCASSPQSGGTCSKTGGVVTKCDEVCVTNAR